MSNGQSRPEFHPKGWGYELWIANKPEYCGKLLHFVSGKSCSWHYHEWKDETFYVHSGTLLVEYSKEDDLSRAERTLLFPGDSFYVPAKLRHKMTATKGNVDMFEFSTEHFEDDSYRIIKGD